MRVSTRWHRAGGPGIESGRNVVEPDRSTDALVRPILRQPVVGALRRAGVERERGLAHREPAGLRLERRHAVVRRKAVRRDHGAGDDEDGAALDAMPLRRPAEAVDVLPPIEIAVDGDTL